MQLWQLARDLHRICPGTPSGPAMNSQPSCEGAMRLTMNRTLRYLSVVLVVLAITSGFSSPMTAADWPTYRRDNQRSGMTPESIRGSLAQTWIYTSLTPPQQAWTGPAKWDAYAKIKGLTSMRNFDPAFFVIVVDDSVFFGSSVDDAVHCLDATNGEEKWVFASDGPVRLPPSWHRGRIYFGSDDGYAYCLEATQGTMVW